MRLAPSLAFGACVAVITTTVAASCLWSALAFVPLINLIAIPCLIASVLLLLHTLPFAAYLLLAQTDAPKYRGGLFLPFSPARHLGILVAVFYYVRFVVCNVPTFLLAIASTILRLRATSQEPASSPLSTPPWWQQLATFGITYHKSPGRLASRLDVYRAQTPQPSADSPELTATLSRISSMGTLPDVDQGTRCEPSEFPPHVWNDAPVGEVVEDENLRPVVVFLYDVGMMGPVRPRRWMFGLVGLKLAEQGYVSVVPDITTYPDGQMEEMVTDVRAVLAWVRKEIRNFGGDPDLIYLCGHGLGAHLGMYTLAQDAVVHSRQRIEIHNATSNWSHLGYPEPSTREIPNGVKSLRVYGSEIELPPVKGVILLSPIADVIKQVRHESKCWLEHVSPLRRSLGSTQTRCMRHSLGHILFAAKDLIETDELPAKALVIHGNKDLLVPSWQAGWLVELFKGLEIQTTLREYSRLAHFDIVTNLMTGFETEASKSMLVDICSFIESV